MNTPRVPAPVRLIAVLAAALSVSTAALAAPAAAAAPEARPAGRFASALQHRDGSISVTGFAYDRRDASASITVCVVSGGKCVRKVRADGASAGYDRSHHLVGRHAFRAHVPSLRPGVTLRLAGFGHGRRVALDHLRVQSPGERIIKIAKRYVGHSRYVDGGSSPQQGFDCSGYTRWVYAHAHVAALPHNAEAQRRVGHMRHVSQAQARPGDLVFYFSGGGAYHVAIYAGHGQQYAAATPQDGIRYQAVWSSDVEYRTNWH
jgi:cell wall-associated NlpC family hydrolase